MILLERFGAIASTDGEILDGMVLITPTSIAYTGTSASIGTNGSVTFSAVTNLELRGVFSADYDNYMIAFRNNQTIDNYTHTVRLMSGTTPASGNNYTRQVLYADGSTVAGARTTTQTSARMGFAAINKYDGYTAFIYGPYLAQPTAFRSVDCGTSSDAYIEDWANTHSLSTSYDGLNLFCTQGAYTGLVSVYGLVGA